jgi:hypothetical protein
MFRVIFVAICILIFLYAGFKLTNIDKKTSKGTQVIWGLVVLSFLVLLTFLVINS